jgi:hypothetical protein
MNVTETKCIRLPSQEEVEKLVEPLAALLCSVGSPDSVRHQIMAAVDKRVDEDNRLTRNWIVHRTDRQCPAKR